MVAQVEPGSPAAEAGLQTGDVIREVNRKPVKNAAEFVQKLEKAQGRVPFCSQSREEKTISLRP